jgi:hypothetical protein
MTQTYEVPPSYSFYPSLLLSSSFNATFGAHISLYCPFAVCGNVCGAIPNHLARLRSNDLYPGPILHGRFLFPKPSLPPTLKAHSGFNIYRLLSKLPIYAESLPPAPTTAGCRSLAAGRLPTTSIARNFARLAETFLHRQQHSLPFVRSLFRLGPSGLVEDRNVLSSFAIHLDSAPLRQRIASFLTCNPLLSLALK